MEVARSFRDLRVYKAAREAATLLFEKSKSFPREERYSLTDQIRRSSRAVNAMIAEKRGRGVGIRQCSSTAWMRHWVKHKKRPKHGWTMPSTASISSKATTRDSMRDGLPSVRCFHA